MSDFYLSMADLALVDGFLEVYGKGDQKAIYDILYENGVDISQDVNEVYCTHRTLQDKIFTGVRFESYERSDKEWLSTGAASLNAHIKSCNDVEQRMALRMMSREGSSDGSWV